LAIFRKFYSRQGLWSLFLITALPLHIWTFILAFRDFDWVTERTNSWDAVGVVAYGLIFTLIESLIIFIVTVLLGFLVSSKWSEKKRLALMGVMVVVLSLWSMFNQTYFLREMQPSAQFIGFYINTGRPLLFLYATAFILVVLSVALPTYGILTSDKVEKAVTEGFERLSTLMVLYLVFDAAALVILIIRNI
jgi:hypothetical protein